MVEQQERSSFFSPDGMKQIVHVDHYNEGGNYKTDSASGLVKLNMDSIKRHLLIPIIRIVFHEFRARFPRSLKLYLLACYTKNMLMRKPFQCFFIMRRYDSSGLSTLDLIAQHINDHYLL